MILVTGGAGYVGSHFIKTYLALNPDSEVVVVDNLSEGHKEALDFSDRIRLYDYDIGNVVDMELLLTRYPFRAVVHFAASCYVGESQLNPVKYFQNNVVNSLNLFRSLKAAGLRRVVFSSSCATYGIPQVLPITESHPQEPVNIYGLTKLMVEKALGAYADTLGWSYVALRYFNAAGADDHSLLGEHHEPETHLIPLVLQAALGKRPAIEIYGEDYPTPDGTCIRDYIHVNDLATAHCQALQYLEEHPGCKEAINLGTASGASVREIIELSRQVTGRDIPVTVAPRRDGDPPSLVANPDKAKALLGWEPRYDLQQIIETAWAWEQNPRY